jgi:general stress protein 26
VATSGTLRYHSGRQFIAFRGNGVAYLYQRWLAFPFKQNPNVEFTCQFNENDEDCCIRILGKARMVKDNETKTSIAKRIGFFYDHWSGPEDPDYTLLEVLPDELQYVAPSGTKQFRL